MSGQHAGLGNTNESDTIEKCFEHHHNSYFRLRGEKSNSFCLSYDFKKLLYNSNHPELKFTRQKTANLRRINDFKKKKFKAKKNGSSEV